MSLQCPACGAENAPGKLFCYKCGAKLVHPKAAEVGAETPAGAPARLPEGVVAKVADKKKGGASKIAAAAVLVVLLALAALAFLALQPLPYPSAPSGDSVTEEMNKRLQAAQNALNKTGEAELELRASEINYLLDQSWPAVEAQMGGGFIQVKGMRLEMPGEGLSTYLLLSVKGKPAYLRIDTDVTTRDGTLIIEPRGGALGKLPLSPGLVKFLVSLATGRPDPFTVADLPLYFDKVRLERGRMFVRVTTDTAITGGPAGRLFEKGRKAKLAEHYAEAVSAFRRIVEEYPDSDFAARAKIQYEALLKEANRRLGAADADYQTGRYDKAKEGYEYVTRNFPGTDAAEKAAEQLANLASDPAARRYFKQKEVERTISSKFQYAENLLNAGKYDRAAEVYQEIIDEYPDSSYAAKAKERLKDLGRY